MKKLATLTALALLISTGAYAESPNDQSPDAVLTGAGTVFSDANDQGESSNDVSGMSADDHGGSKAGDKEHGRADAGDHGGKGHEGKGHEGKGHEGKGHN